MPYELLCFQDKGLKIRNSRFFELPCFINQYNREVYPLLSFEPFRYLRTLKNRNVSKAQDFWTFSKSQI